jgi:hypothetical protein
MRIGHTLIAAALLVVATGLAGCKKEDKTAQTPPPAPNAAASGHDDGDGHSHGDHDHDADGHSHGDHDHDADDVAANLAKLSDSDRVLADKQQVCLVGDEPLGAMGVPIKLDVDGTPIFICCAGCEDAILADKEKFVNLLAERLTETDGDGS